MKKVSGVRNITKKRYNPVVVTVLFITILFALGAVFFFFFLDRFFYDRTQIDMHFFTPDEQMRQAISDEGFLPDEMFDRTIDLLVKKTESDPFVTSWYVLPGQLQRMPEIQSDQLNAMDQINLARVYIVRGDKRSAQQLLDAISDIFSDDNGRIVGYILTNGSEEDSRDLSIQEEKAISGPCLEATTAYLRALLEYYHQWGTEADWMRIESLADAIFDGTDFYNDIAFAPSKMSELIVGLEDYDNYFTDLQDETVYSAYRLSSLDLFAFRTLAEVDPEKYQLMYDVALNRVSDGMLTDDLPLFARAYSESGGGYVYFMGEEAHIELFSSLKVMLHLAEIDALPASSLAWLRQQIYNNGILYTHYDILWGTPVTAQEDIAAYGLTLRIAVAVEDHALYAHTLVVLTRRRATLSTSPARHMIFRQLTGQRNMVIADDNMQALLAMSAR